MFVSTQLVAQKEKQELEKLFNTLDKNEDGRLSKEELVEGFLQFYGDKGKAEQVVNTLMENIDMDRNGYIDYSEFLLSAMNKKQMLSKENLKHAFQLFDKVITFCITSV